MNGCWATEMSLLKYVAGSAVVDIGGVVLESGDMRCLSSPSCAMAGLL